MKYTMELKAQLDELNRQIEEARASEVPAALQAIRDLIALYGFTPEDIFATASRKGRAGKPRESFGTGLSTGDTARRPKGQERVPHDVRQIGLEY